MKWSRLEFPKNYTLYVEEGIKSIVKTKKSITLNNQTILITGVAGFIGANLIRRLLQELNGSFLIGIDNLNDYYDPQLKEYRFI